MHNIEPHYLWRDLYIASEDKNSPFFGRKYNEFEYSHQLYNFYLHPQWDPFGSATLYLKVLFVEYDEGYAIFEMIGEWNDALHNDIMFLKRRVIEKMLKKGISKFLFFCDNVLNFHSSIDDDYYAEWSEEAHEEGGWIVLANTRKHVEEEMEEGNLAHYAHFGPEYNDLNWRSLKPQFVFHMVDALVQGRVKRILG